MADAGEISFEELTQAQPVKLPSAEISFDELRPASAAAKPAPTESVMERWMNTDDEASISPESAAVAAGYLKNWAISIYDSLANYGQKVKTELQTSSNPIEAYGKIGTGNVEAAANFITGIFSGPIALSTKKLPGEKALFEKMLSPEAFKEYDKDTTMADVTYQPRTAIGQAGAKVIGSALIPISDVFEAGAKGLEKVTPMSEETSAQVLGTVALLAPIALKAAKAGKASPQIKAEINSVFDELAAKSPEGAEVIAKEVEIRDPKLAEQLRSRAAEMRKASEEKLKEVGAEQAKAKLADEEISFEDLTKSVGEVSYEDILAEVSGKEKPVAVEQPVPEDILIQRQDKTFSSSGKEVDGITVKASKADGSFGGVVELQDNLDGTYQVFNSAVDKGLEGRGLGTALYERALGEAAAMGSRIVSDSSVSESAARVWEALKRKGYDIRTNTDLAKPGDAWYMKGRLLSNDKHKPVFEVVPNEKSAEAGQIVLAGLENQRVKLREGLGQSLQDLDISVRSAEPEVIEMSSELPESAAENFNLKDTVRKIPGVSIAEGKLKEYFDQAIRTFSPESLGPQAKKAGAILAKSISEQMQKDSSFFHRAQNRMTFWDRLGPEETRKFVAEFESGRKFDDPVLAKASAGYRQWNREMAAVDAKLGIQYEPIDNYLYHTFKNADKLAEYFKQKYGPKWGNPGFMKDRTFDLYEEAVAAGFEPRFTNLEQIMLARQHASDIAQMRIDSLRDMEKYGIAWKITKANPDRPSGVPVTEWRAPNGERYWVHDNASAVLHNAFDTQSLWNLEGIVGDAFRGAMYLKNTIVPIKLALSAFHPLHVATIDNATGMVRATKPLLIGMSQPITWFKEMLQAGAYKEMLQETTGQLKTLAKFEPTGGNRLLQVWQGKIADIDKTPADLLGMQYIAEGGFVPEMSSQYKTTASANFRIAVAKQSVTAAFHAPFAIIQSLQRPMFEVWIPSLKIASYLKDIEVALKVNPKLLEDSGARLVAFRKIAKSVDNRYGEMAYNTMFWNRWVKDLGVANTLSLGWQMGFLREYGGAATDIIAMTRGKDLNPMSTDSAWVQHVKNGKMDRPLFVMYYTTQALMYAGLMTWTMTGQPPKELLDYTHPRTGEKNPDGSDARLNTMFYPREFVSIAKHMEQQGVVSGLGHLAASKASGVIGQVYEWASGVDSFGNEIRDPDAPAYKQLEQTLASTLFNLEPISLKAIREGQKPGLALLGFGAAPKYITDSKTASAIKQVYQTYYAKKQTPYERTLYSFDMSQLRRYYAEGDSDKFGNLFDSMQERYKLNGADIRRIEQALAKSEDPSITMFQHFTWEQQQKLLDKMTPAEREVYLPKSNRGHVRFQYSPPEDR